MKTSRQCPNCGQPLPASALEGLCPECMLQIGALADSAQEPVLGPGGTVVCPAGQAVPPVAPAIGQRFGRYRILRRLGHGGMGVVYEAEETDSGRRVALKVISHKLTSPQDRARFLREGRLAASINHPNCVYVYGTEEVEGRPVIAMELVTGGTLQQRLARQGPLPVGHAVDAILQVIDGLEAAHALGILHRDIKPSNCFEEESGTVKIGDFGLSISTSPRLETDITESGAVVGTPAFCSPEQLRGEEVNARSDMYAVGVTLFQLLTGKLPFEGSTMPQLIANTLEKRATSPAQLRREVPNGLARIVLRCLEKHPSERFHTYADLRRALQPYSSASPSPATLGLRFMAGLMDLILLNAVGQVVLFMTLGDPFAMIDRLSGGLRREAVVILPWFAVVILYFALAEWRWGATAGKALCRLRVLQENRNDPTLPQALLRATFFVLVPVLPAWGWVVATGDPLVLVESSSRAHALSLCYGLLLALLFVSVRRRNGFAALHDLATHTRVVSHAEWERRPALDLSEPRPAGVESKPILGPYHVLEPLGRSTDAEWVEGYDLRLLRRVLLRTVPPGTPPLPMAVRQVSRPGRLRWLTGRRDAGHDWDAFEGAGGQSLVKLAEHPQPWRQVRFWLHDLARELSAAANEETSPAALEPDRVWITRDGRAKLADYPLPGIDEPDGTCGAAASRMPAMPDAGPMTFLDRVAAVALAGRASERGPAVAVRAIVPMHARRFLEALPNLPTPEAVVEALRPLLRRPAEVTRLRRAMVVTACLALPMLGSLAAMLGLSLSQRWEREKPELTELSRVLNVWQARNLPFIPAERLPSERLTGIYIAAHFAEVVRNEKLWSTAMARALIPPEARQLAERSLDEYAFPSPSELEEAEKWLGPIARQAGEAATPRLHSLGPMVVWSGLLLCTAMPALIAALLFRGGLALRITGVTFARRDGRHVSRLRLLWRGVVAWSPVAGAAVLGVAAMATRSPTQAWLSGLVLVILTAWSLWLPERGLQDRLAGTWPVPR